MRRLFACGMFLGFALASIGLGPTPLRSEGNQLEAKQKAAPPAKQKEQTVATTARVDAALAVSISFDFTEAPLSEAIGFVRDFTGINILIDPKGLDALSLDPQTPVTLQVKQVPLKAALERLLDPLELTAVNRDGILLITSKDEAESKLQTRLYPILDLIVVQTEDGGEIMEEEFLSMLRQAVATDTWDENGGEGTIAFVFATGSLVVRQTSAVHAELEQLLVQMQGLHRNLGDAAKQAGITDLAQLGRSYVTQVESRREAERQDVETGFGGVAQAPAHRRAQAEAELVQVQLERAKLELEQFKKSIEKQ